MARAPFAALLLAACAHHGFSVDWSFKNIEEGYDHLSRIDVYVDGQKFSESQSAPQSRPGHLNLDLPEGKHEVKVIALAMWEGQWEEHVIANDYSIDCLWEGSVSGGKPLKLVFDLDNGTIVR